MVNKGRLEGVAGKGWRTSIISLFSSSATYAISALVGFVWAELVEVSACGLLKLIVLTVILGAFYCVSFWFAREKISSEIIDLLAGTEFALVAAFLVKWLVVCTGWPNWFAALIPMGILIAIKTAVAMVAQGCRGEDFAGSSEGLSSHKEEYPE